MSRHINKIVPGRLVRLGLQSAMSAIEVTLSGYAQDSQCPDTHVSRHRTQDIDEAIRRAVYKHYGRNLSIQLDPRASRSTTLRTGYVYRADAPLEDQAESIIRIQAETTEVSWVAETVGHPISLKNGKRQNFYLDDDAMALARVYGHGNASEGIRIALQCLRNIGVVSVSKKPTVLKRRNIYIDDVSLNIAQALGHGNASEGIRIALAKSTIPLE